MNPIPRIFLTVCLAIPVAAPAAEAEYPEAPSSGSTQRAGGVDLRSVIASVSQRTHKKFLLDPRVSGIVGLVGLEPRDVTYPILLSILAVHGFSTYDQEGVVVVVPDIAIRQVGMPPVVSTDIRAPDAAVVTTIIALKNRNAAELVPVLRPLMPLNANMAAIVSTNALMLTDRASNVRRLLTIIETIDKLPGMNVPPAKQD